MSRWVQTCLLCQGTGIDPENSYPAWGPSFDSMGEPPVLEPCLCQYVPVPCICCGEVWYFDQPACVDSDCDSHTWDDDRWRKETGLRYG